MNIFDEKWADKLSFALNYSQEDKQLQNANLMQKVFGGKYRKSHNYSSSVEYEKKNILKGLSFFLTGRYDFTTTQNVDEEARRYSSGRVSMNQWLLVVNHNSRILFLKVKRAILLHT